MRRVRKKRKEKKEKREIADISHLTGPGLKEEKGKEKKGRPIPIDPT